MTISQSEAAPLIQRHIKALYDIPTKAWDEYHAKVPKELLVSFGARTRASAVHDLMVRNAARYSSEVENVALFEVRMMRGLVLSQLLAIRLKKLDEESGSRSQPTEQVTKFRNQEQLDGIDALHNLELGYVLNESETNIAEVRLVCPSGDGVAWSMRIGPEAAEPSVVDLLPKPSDPGPDKPAKITPKKPDSVVVPIRAKKDES